ncbi:lipoprotein [Desulfohalovibrio reitneri]|uniref:LptM family lipoprotein n=1 Tax=Desulfohalovibrio reitneri TaxID=1307759 RepID=UPI0004A6E5AB|nr:hypothetical protein [Desulfohalovibrio reitneri]
MRRLFTLVLILVFAFSLAACGKSRPAPQARRVVQPSEVPGSFAGPGYDLAAVRYQHTGEGLDYTEAGVEPVYLVFENRSADTPTVDYDQVRGVSPDGEYLPYSIDEATQVVTESEAFSATAENAARSGTLGALLGAGLGAIAGSIGGGDNIWHGAVIGGAIGGMAGGVYGGAGSERAVKDTVQKQLSRYAWDSRVVPENYTKVGYVYFPAAKGITKLKAPVSVNGTITTVAVLPMASPASVRAEEASANATLRGK